MGRTPAPAGAPASTGAVTTVYVGDYLEWNGSAETMVKYYSLAIYRPELIVDQDYQRAIGDLGGWFSRQYVGPGPGR